MTKQHIDIERLKDTIQYDPTTGEMTRLDLRGGRRVKGLRRSRQITIEGKLESRIPVVWLLVHGVEPPRFVFHLDGDDRNFALANLSSVSPGRRKKKKVSEIAQTS